MDADTPTSPFDPDLRDHSAEAELESYFVTQRKTGVVLQRIYPPTAFPRVRSRVGGLPQLPQALEWPMGQREGAPAPMHFLAQIDCAELPRVEAQMPEHGMLFFFAVNDEEQIWDTESPQERVRVLYASEVSQDQAEREPPEDLRPINCVIAPDSPYADPCWLLPGEDGPRIHVRWPLVARLMDTWPDPELLPQDGSDPDYQAYQQRWSELRLGAVVAATGLMPNTDAAVCWEQPLSQSWKFPAQWLRHQRDFPQAGILMDRLARILGNELSRRSRDRSAHPDVLDWVRRAAEIGWDNAPDETAREAFRNWILEQISDGDESEKLTDLSMGRIFTRGLLAAIAYAGRSPTAAALIPPQLYRDLEGEHLPFAESHRSHPDGRKQCAVPRVHQMLGHVPFLQNCGPEVDGEAVCLLQLAWDPAIDLTFGDCGQATFWITREDLANLRFDRVAAVVESH